MKRDEIANVITYDPATGLFVWKERPRSLFPTEHACNAWNARFKGKEALVALSAQGYYRGTILGLRVAAHRVAWLLSTGEWPNNDVDHINGVRTDNRIANLRVVSRSENMKNSKKHTYNTSGVTGVEWLPDRGRWRARICSERNRKTIGYFSSLEEAIKARKTAEITYSFHENHGRS